MAKRKTQTEQKPIAPNRLPCAWGLSRRTTSSGRPTSASSAGHARPEEGTGRCLSGAGSGFVAPGWDDLFGRYTSVTEKAQPELALQPPIEDDDRVRIRLGFFFCRVLGP